jgi:predicted ATPase
MVNDHFFVLTGAFGSGKSTLLEHLRGRGITGIIEPARPILSEQRSIGGAGVPDKDPRLFAELMLSRMLQDYRRCEVLGDPILFDRGIPDLLAYTELFGFELEHCERAAQIYRYHPRVFMAPAWQQIYCTDEERTLPFSVADSFGQNLRAIYSRLGYAVIDLPYASVQERADFVLGHL